MHSGFDQNQQQHSTLMADENNSCTPVLLSMNQPHILEQIQTLPFTQQLFLDHQHHFLPNHHHHHHHYAASAASSAFFPMTFKLGLDENFSSNNGIDLVRGNKQFEDPEEARQHSSLKMSQCWQNQQDSGIKELPLWEPLTADQAYANNERQDPFKMNQKEALTTCLEGKSSQLFGELEVMYKRLGTSESNQTGPNHEILPVGLDHGSEASVGEEAFTTASLKTARKKRKKNKKNTTGKELLNPMSEFFESLVKQAMDHQENLHKKFRDVIERLDEERRVKEEAWRNRELAHFQQEVEDRAKENALAASREATIISYLEKIAEQKINSS